MYSTVYYKLEVAKRLNLNYSQDKKEKINTD